MLMLGAVINQEVEVEVENAKISTMRTNALR